MLNTLKAMYWLVCVRIQVTTSMLRTRLPGRSEAQHFYPAATPFQQQQRASSSMGPPPGLGSNAQAGSWGPPLMAPGTMLAPSPAIGYTSNHFSYGAERSRWAKIPYASAGVETFTMVVSVFSKIPGKLRGSLVAVSIISPPRRLTATDVTID